MKELTIEEKAQRYDEAIEIAKEINNEQRAQPFNVMTRVFPKLEESEDEKIKELIHNLLTIDTPSSREIFAIYGKSKEDVIAWLEKQGKQIKSYDTCDSSIIDNKKSPYGEKGDFGYFEEKPTDYNAEPKHEPKFHEGEWINGYYTNYKVLSVNNEGYVVEDVDGNKINILFENERFHHLWTIQDAKDGDVLSDGTTIFIFKDLLSDGSVMSYCDYDTDSGESDAFCSLSMNLMCSKITPATKEQRNLLFQKMKESGYEWDSEKKVKE